jgi:hypothetical protein
LQGKITKAKLKIFISNINEFLKDENFINKFGFEKTEYTTKESVALIRCLIKGTMGIEELKGVSELWYPGFIKTSQGVIQNLSSYRGENLSMSLSFDIERHVKLAGLELLPFTYSFMITSSFSAPSGTEIQQSLKSFKEKASQLEGFCIEKDYEPEAIDYRNLKQNNLLLNWLYHSKSITIGVIQDKQLPSLGTVLESLPYAVNLFNSFSLYPLRTDIVKNSMEIAGGSMEMAGSGS